MSDLPSIPGYGLDRELGQGGMARVYLAHEAKLDRPVALKVMMLSPTQDRALSERFVKEARTAARLVHSNIVSIYDVGEAGLTYYMAMEFLEGGSLRQRIQHGPLDPAEALGIARQVASALDHAHEHGYVHRDIKPDNIMFRRDGTAVVTDFGIARAVDAATKLTKTGMSIGTPHYMSPEQAMGKTLDGRSDLYAVGVVLFEMLTGRVPFDADDSVSIAVKHRMEPPPPLPGALSRYQDLLDELLVKDPARRIATGARLCEAIDALLGVRRTPGRGVPLAVATPQPQPRTFDSGPGLVREGGAPAPPSGTAPRSKVVAILVGALGVLVVILMVVLSQGGGSGREDSGAAGAAPSRAATNSGANTTPSQVDRRAQDDAARQRAEELERQLAVQNTENARLQREQQAREQAAAEQAREEALEEARQQGADAERARLQEQERRAEAARQEQERQRGLEEAARQKAALEAQAARDAASRPAQMMVDTFVGADRCKMCHRIEYESWARTPHASAWAALKPKEQATAEYVSCHATNGAVMPNVQCEACHGAGADYKALATMKDRERAIAAGLIIPDAAYCTGKCHNASCPKFRTFEWRTAAPKVHVHKAR